MVIQWLLSGYVIHVNHLTHHSEGELSKVNELMDATVDYAKTHPVFGGYKAVKYSRKYHSNCLPLVQSDETTAEKQSASHYMINNFMLNIKNKLTNVKIHAILYIPTIKEAMKWQIRRKSNAQRWDYLSQ